MATHDLRIKSDLLAPLAALAFVQHGSRPYYRQLRKSADPILAVGAWCALLDGKLVARAFWDEIIALSRVRRRPRPGLHVLQGFAGAGHRPAGRDPARPLHKWAEFFGYPTA